MPIVLSILALLAGLVAARLYIRGDRRRDLRRCPRCLYDVSSVPAMTCPECGFVGEREDLFHFTRRRPRYGWVATLCFVAAIAIFITGTARHGLLGSLPRPVLAWALDAFVPGTPIPAGADIPSAPTPGAPQPPRGKPLWTRLSQNQQYAEAIRTWAALVSTDDPKVLADLPRIHAALSEMDTWKLASDQTAWVDSWVFRDKLEPLRRDIESLPGRHVTLTLADGAKVSLDRNELFMLAFQPPRNMCEGIGLQGGPYIGAPQEYLSAMATSCGPGPQRYALERLGPEPSGAVDIDALLTSLESSASTKATQDVATNIRGWRKSFIARAVPGTQPPR